MKKMFLVIAILFISIPSFAQRQINPTPGQIFWLEKRGMIQLTEKLGKPIDESCKPVFEATCTGLITDLAIFSEDGGKTIYSSPRRMSIAKVLIISKNGNAYEIVAKIIKTPSSWESMLTGGEWVKKKNQNLWRFSYTFPEDETDEPVFCDVTRQVSEEAGEEYFVRLR